MQQSVLMIKPPNQMCVPYKHICLGPMYKAFQKGAGLGLEAKKEKPMVEEPGHHAC